MWLVVGLGNPGEKYETTRHNMGFLVLDALRDEINAPEWSRGFSGLMSLALICGQKSLLLKPQTFMNRSGESVAAAASFYKIDPSHLIVAYDELDLKLGEIRIKSGGGLAGHNGLKDIASRVGEEFLRVRLGIDRPKEKGRESGHVLGRFTDSELLTVSKILPKAIFAIETLISSGIEEAQSKAQVRL